MSQIQPDITMPFRMYVFTEEQEQRAVMFSPETIAYLEHQATNAATVLCSFAFDGNAEEQQMQRMAYVALKSKRDCLLTLLLECQEAYGRLAQAAPAAA